MQRRERREQALHDIQGSCFVTGVTSTEIPVRRINVDSGSDKRDVLLGRELGVVETGLQPTKLCGQPLIPHGTI
jgi:hypothetical protein